MDCEALGKKQSRHIFAVLFQHFPERTEEKHENIYYDSQHSGGYSKSENYE
jgi:hypothetical protein